ncbi:MAG: DEAD/DEAH box helicase family protein, partial [Hungatella sp.]
MYANIIIDISHENVDRMFQYRIPAELDGQILVGMQILVPFGSGNHERKGYVVEITPEPEYDLDKIKEVAGIVVGSISAKSQLIQLAWWMKECYGSTMNQALKTVLPVKQKIKSKEQMSIRCLLEEPALLKAIQLAEKKKYKARERLLRALSDTPVLPYTLAVNQMNLSAATLKPLIEQGLIALDSKEVYRNPITTMKKERNNLCLNEQQQAIVTDFCSSYDAGKRGTSLIHGITGSGKTEVYMEIISRVLDQQKQVIVLIP